MNKIQKIIFDLKIQSQDIEFIYETFLKPCTFSSRLVSSGFTATGSGNDGTADDVCEIDTLRTDVVNYLERPCSDLVTKCDKVDKLHAFWQESAAILPEESVKLYVNDRSASFPVGHYESPIKFRNTSVASNSDNDLVTPTNQRSTQSYIDMEGKKSSQAEAEMESEELLVFANGNDDNGDQQARSNWPRGNHRAWRTRR